MAGPDRRLARAVASDRSWDLRRSEALCRIPAGGPTRSLDQGQVVPVPIARTDGYALWAACNAFRRIGHIRPAGRVESPPHCFPDCTPSRFRAPGQYVLVLIQVATGLAADQDRDAARRERLDEHQRTSHGGLRVRRAFKRRDGLRGQFRLDEGVRFVTALVADWWWPCFLQRIAEDCVRWEIGHARLPLAWHPPTPAAFERDTSAWLASPTWNGEDRLLAGDVMVIIDQGCPFAHPAFRSDTRSRVRYAWFQGADALTRAADLPRPMFHGTALGLFPYGVELRGSCIDALLIRHRRGAGVDEAACYEAVGYERMLERSSHGGHVMSLACGHPNPLTLMPGEDWLRGRGHGAGDAGPRPVNVADRLDRSGKADIIFIELPRDAVADSSGGAMNVLLVDALNYVLRRTAPGANITINCSYGTHGGPHDRSSLLEQALDDLLVRARLGGTNMTLVVPIGNAYQSACHAFHPVRAGDDDLVATVDVPADKRTDTFIEAWYPQVVEHAGVATGIDVTDLELTLTRPDGQRLRCRPGNALTTWTAPVSGSAPSVTVVQTGEATDTRHRILVVLAPTWQPGGQEPEGLAPYGHWTLRLRSRRQDEVAIPVDVWIERDDPIVEPLTDRQSRFFVKPPADPADEFATGPVTRSASFTSYATGTQVLAAGGYVRPRHRDDRFTDDGTAPLLATYSSAGSSMLHLPMNKPDALAPVDDGAELAGRLGAGNLGASWVRRNGTSVAAPQLARWVLNSGDPMLGGLPGFTPSLAGERGDGLSIEGDLLQIVDRSGLGLRLED